MPAVSYGLSISKVVPGPKFIRNLAADQNMGLFSKSHCLDHLVDNKKTERKIPKLRDVCERHTGTVEYDEVNN